MARKKMPPPPAHLTDNYYAYYDPNTNQLLSVTNEKISLYSDYLEVDFDTYERLVTGREKFSDYLLGHIKTEDKTVLKLIPVVEQAYSFKNTMLEVISENKIKDPELIVEWHGINKEWNFFVSATAKGRLNVKLDSAKILFFIILESDYDFLIRTIIIDSQELLSQKCVGIPFISEIENHIGKLSVASRLIFESQTLRTVNDNN
jgi:hypothetical protein